MSDPKFTNGLGFIERHGDVKSIVERLAVANLKAIRGAYPLATVRGIARSAAHWAIAVLYMAQFGKAPSGTSEDAMSELMKETR